MIKKLLANTFRGPRAKFLSEHIDAQARTVLDVGCRDLYFTRKLQNMGYDVTAADKNPSSPDIQALDIQNMSELTDASFDVVVAMEVLEHVPDPVPAMRELKRVSAKQLIISVPNEPWFSFWRFNTWEEEHLWAVAWPAVHYHFGTPMVEQIVGLGRYRFFVWRLDR